jgi:hypothetical protein
VVVLGQLTDDSGFPCGRGFSHVHDALPVTGVDTDALPRGAVRVLSGCAAATVGIVAHSERTPIITRSAFRVAPLFPILSTTNLTCPRAKSY